MNENFCWKNLFVVIKVEHANVMGRIHILNSCRALSLMQEINYPENIDSLKVQWGNHFPADEHLLTYILDCYEIVHKYVPFKKAAKSATKLMRTD